MNKVLSGLHLVSNQRLGPTGLSGLTFCGRFNLKQLTIEKSISFMIASPRQWRLLKIKAGYALSFMSFGNADKHYSAPSWIIGTGPTDPTDPSGPDFMIWSTLRWHSICVAYLTSDNHVTLIKVYYAKVRSVPGNQQPLVLACVDAEGKLNLEERRGLYRLRPCSLDLYLSGDTQVFCFLPAKTS